jgi:hypothetical protein
MPKTINFEGQTYSLPDDASDQEILNFVQAHQSDQAPYTALYAKPQPAPQVAAPPPSAQTIPQRIANYALQNNPVTDVARDVWNVLTGKPAQPDAVAPLTEQRDAMAAQQAKALQEWRSGGDKGLAAMRGVVGSIPVVGPTAMAGYDAFNQGRPVAGAVNTALAAAQLALPGASAELRLPSALRAGGTIGSLTADLGPKVLDTADMGNIALKSWARAGAVSRVLLVAGFQNWLTSQDTAIDISPDELRSHLADLGVTYDRHASRIQGIRMRTRAELTQPPSSTLAVEAQA